MYTYIPTYCIYLPIYLTYMPAYIPNNYKVNIIVIQWWIEAGYWLA